MLSLQNICLVYVPICCFKLLTARCAYDYLQENEQDQRAPWLSMKDTVFSDDESEVSAGAMQPDRYSWLRGTVVECRSLAGELSLSHT